MANELQQKLSDLYDLKNQLISNQKTVNHALTLTEKTIKEVEATLLVEAINSSATQRFNMKSSDAIKDFGLEKNIFSSKDTLEDIRIKLFDYLKTQSILDFYLLYDPNGVDMVNKLINSIYNIE